MNVNCFGGKMNWHLAMVLLTQKINNLILLLIYAIKKTDFNIDGYLELVLAWSLELFV